MKFCKEDYSQNPKQKGLKVSFQFFLIQFLITHFFNFASTVEKVLKTIEHVNF